MAPTIITFLRARSKNVYGDVCRNWFGMCMQKAVNEVCVWEWCDNGRDRGIEIRAYPFTSINLHDIGIHLSFFFIIFVNFMSRTS